MSSGKYFKTSIIIYQAISDMYYTIQIVYHVFINTIRVAMYPVSWGIEAWYVNRIKIHITIVKLQIEGEEYSNLQTQDLS